MRVAPRVMAVLVFLLDQEGEVASKDRILATVWGGRAVSDEVLTNAICELRKAFHDQPREPRFIQTVSKKGYRIVAPVSRCSPAVAVAEPHPALQQSPASGVRKPISQFSGVERPWGREMQPEKTSAGRWPAALAAGVLAAVLTASFLSVRSNPAPAPPDTIPSMVVLPFDNLTDDRELDWLRIGLAELMTTGLSRSPRLRLASRERVDETLLEAERSARPKLSPSARRAVALRSKADLLLLGDFAKAGDRIRISVRIQSSPADEILLTEQVEGSGEKAIFQMVDQLTTRVLTRWNLLRRGDKFLDRELAAVTTSSIEAYRNYAEGLEKYYYNFDSKGAAERYERAIAVDPGFALALSKLVVVHLTLGQFEKADAYARRALEHVDRLAEPERHYVTGNYYVLRERTFDRALEAYHRALAFDPYLSSARHNIGFIYFQLERYQEAIEYLEELVADGMSFPGTYRVLALSYAALGEPGKERQVLQRYVRLRPEKWIGHRNLAHHFLRWGRLEEARTALLEADALRAGRLEPYDCWQLQVLQEEWGTAGADEESLTTQPCPLRSSAVKLLYQGRASEALSWLDQIPLSSSAAGDWTGASRSLSAHILLEAGFLEQSLVQSKRAQLESGGNPAEWESHFYASIVHALGGDWGEAEESADALKRLTEGLPTRKERRRWHHLRGNLALVHGDPLTALDHLRRAAASLPPRGFPVVTQLPQHVPIWYSMAMVHLALGDDASAARWLERIVESTTERVAWPIPYVRSLYFLARIHDRRGETERAVLHYRRFVELWGDGELDRNRVVEAKGRMIALAAPAST